MDHVTVTLPDGTDASLTTYTHADWRKPLQPGNWVHGLVMEVKARHACKHGDKAPKAQPGAGRDIEVRVEFAPELRFVTLRLGIAPLRDDDRLIEEAAAAAAEADVAVVVVGSADGAESEGYDRESLALTAGVPLHVVAGRLGDDPRTLLGVYAHLLPHSDEQAAEAVAAALVVGSASESVDKALTNSEAPEPETAL